MRQPEDFVGRVRDPPFTACAARQAGPGPALRDLNPGHAVQGAGEAHYFV